QAGLDADSPPKTWDELLAACDKLKGKGIAPIGGGIQDGYWGEWYFGHALAQNVDSTGEAVDLFTGARDFRDPQYHKRWGGRARAGCLPTARRAAGRSAPWSCRSTARARWRGSRSWIPRAWAFRR